MEYLPFWERSLTIIRNFGSRACNIKLDCYSNISGRFTHDYSWATGQFASTASILIRGRGRFHSTDESIWVKKIVYWNSHPISSKVKQQGNTFAAIAKY